MKQQMDKSREELNQRMDRNGEELKNEIRNVTKEMFDTKIELTGRIKETIPLEVVKTKAKVMEQKDKTSKTKQTEINQHQEGVQLNANVAKFDELQEDWSWKRELEIKRKERSEK